MNTNKLPFPELERIYDELAQAIDQCGPENESVFLSKLVLSLAHETGNGTRVSELIAQCLNPEIGPQDERIETLRLV